MTKFFPIRKYFGGKKGKTETSTDDNGIMVIGGSSSYSITPENVATISAKIESIRANYIQ